MKSGGRYAASDDGRRRERTSTRRGGTRETPWQRYAQPTPVGYGLGMLPPPVVTGHSTERPASRSGDDVSGGKDGVKDLRDAFARVAGALRPEESVCRALADHLRLDLDCAHTVRRIEHHLAVLERTARFEAETLPQGAVLWQDAVPPAETEYASALLQVAQSWWMAHRREPGARLPAEAAYAARLIRKMLEVKRENHENEC